MSSFDSISSNLSSGVNSEAKPITANSYKQLPSQRAPTTKLSSLGSFKINDTDKLGKITHIQRLMSEKKTSNPVQKASNSKKIKEFLHK